jgi:hypothetical protein
VTKSISSSEFFPATRNTPETGAPKLPLPLGGSHVQWASSRNTEQICPAYARASDPALNKDSTTTWPGGRVFRTGRDRRDVPRDLLVGSGRTWQGQM